MSALPPRGTRPAGGCAGLGSHAARNTKTLAGVAAREDLWVTAVKGDSYLLEEDVVLRKRS